MDETCPRCGWPMLLIHPGGDRVVEPAIVCIPCMQKRLVEAERRIAELEKKQLPEWIRQA